jgi:hypothetical protein
MKKNLQHKIERDIKQSGLSNSEQNKALEANEAIETDLTKGMVRLEDYSNSDLNLKSWKLTAVLDDILFCQFADTNEDGTMIRRGDIWIPMNAVHQAWRVAKVLLAGPRAKVKPGQHVIFPSTFGLKANNVNNLKNIVFLNEDRIFGVAEPEEQYDKYVK